VQLEVTISESLLPIYSRCWFALIELLNSLDF